MVIRTFLEARSLLTAKLNANVLDPYPGARPGFHFLQESDGINLSRANTFPKGFVMDNTDNSFTRENYFYKKGFNKRTGIFNIYYLVKDKISYTAGGVTYTDIDYAAYMKEQIIRTLQDDVDLTGGYMIERITPINKVEELVSDEFPFKLYQIVISVEVKWVNSYGS